MFRRRWSGLPADPIFQPNFKELGYFINEIDEIRLIENPDYYFKYFISKNERWNERQRFAFNRATSKEIHARLDARGFTTTRLPLNTPLSDPHVPIRTSPNLATATRVVLLFGESCQPLGILAQRVIGGKGGIARGSVLNFITALHDQQQCSATDPTSPAVVLTNTGELWWWPEGGRGLTHVERHFIPMSSAVSLGRFHNAKANEIPGHRSVAEHLRAVFDLVLAGGAEGLGVKKEAKLDIIALGDTADEVQTYLDDDEVWKKVGGRLSSLSMLGSFYDREAKSDGFKKFLEERARAYIIHHMPLGVPVAGPNGNPGTTGFTKYGCPVFSAGAAQHVETMLIEALPSVLKFIQEVAMEGESFKNPVFEIFGDQNDAEPQSSWWGTPDGDGEGEDKGPKPAAGAGESEGGGDAVEASGDRVDGTVKEKTAVRVDKEVVETSEEASQLGGTDAQLDTGVDHSKEPVQDEDGLLPADGGPDTGRHDGKTDGPLSNTDQNAQEMKDLVGEIKALRTD
ncbi:Arb2 domain-containing protein [Chaetomium sp. MPI-SDFR-AT-0129]|nr:Arb2 domain-containing protein [Chaetomium sp. MPI-SDFR-AT-0129]